MKIRKILVTGAAALVLGGSVAGAALASGGASKAPTGAAETTSTVDTDNIQQGDQTTPDTTATADSSSTQGGDGQGEGQVGSETSTTSDGPGGHQDPSGNVDHQFNGEE